MNAKEYFISQNSEEEYNAQSYDYTPDALVEFAESYYQAKSNEWANERYKKALAYYYNETYMNGKSTDAVVNAIWLASGKEGEG